MHLFFRIKSLQILIFYMNDQEVWNNLDYMFFVTLSKLNIFYCFILLLHLTSSFVHTRASLVAYAYVSIESIGCILLSSLALNPILLTSSVNTLRFLLVNLCYDFGIVSYDFFMIFSKTVHIKFVFFWFVYFILKLI